MKKELNVISSKRKYLGVGFIKSRKSDCKIMDMSEEMIASAETKSLKLLEIIVDESSGNDVDRQAMDKLVAWIEKDYINAIVVRSIFDITKDMDDLMEFMRKAEEMNVSIYSMERGMNLGYVLPDRGKEY